jgi:hypothetical protein
MGKIEDLESMMAGLPANLREQMAALVAYANRRRCVYCTNMITIPQNPEETTFWVLNAVWTVTQGTMEVVPLCLACLKKLKSKQLDVDELAIRLTRQLNS